MNIVGCNKGLRAGRAVSAVVAWALLLTCCIKEDAGSCGSVGGPDGEVTVGFRFGTFAIAGPSGADDGWGTSATGARSAAMGASTRAGIPPTGMVEGAFQIGDLWVDGNRGSTQEKPMTWAEATKYCLALKLRLPTYDEMNDIMSYVKNNSPLPDNRRFAYWIEARKDYSYCYWTSTPRSADASFVWMGCLNVDFGMYMDGLRANDKETSARCVKREGEEILPPAPDPGPDVEHPDGLPVGTTFRVVVYAAGADPQSESPVDQNTYKIADTKGTIVASAVDEFGNATDDAARELVLRRGAYDFYYFSPAVPASTAMPNPGRYTDLTNGADYMTLAHREVIDPSQGPKHYIPEVCFYRMGSYIDVRISPREGEIMGTLEVTGDGLQLWGLPGSGRYEIGEYPYRLITEGSGGMVEFSPADFAAEEGKTATVATLGTGGGRAVLPGYARDLQVKVTLTSDGKEMKLDASLAGHNFAPGYRYVVELGVGRIADNPELSIDILPWNEYDWGDGNIGGKIPIDTGGSGTVLDPDTGQNMSRGPAINYCNSQGAGWRLPTQNELLYYWCVQPSIPAGSKFVADSYVTATNNKRYNGYVWNMNFSDGYMTSSYGNPSYYVSCVRDRIQSGVRYPYITTASNGGVIVVLRDEEDGIDEASLFSSRVTETKTGNEASADNRMSRKFRVQKAQSQRSKVAWSDAVSYCDNLTEEGYSDWRLPSQRELMMIWLLGGNSNVSDGDKNDTGVGSASSPFVSSYIYQQSGFTAFSADWYWSATEYSSYSGYAWPVDFKYADSYQNQVESGYVRCVRDEDGSAPTYAVSESSVTPAGDIPAEGKAVSLTLTGTLPPEGVDVRANISGADPVTGKVTASGAAVELAVPENASYSSRTVTFEYLWNGTWIQIGDDCLQEGKKLEPMTFKGVNLTLEPEPDSGAARLTWAEAIEYCKNKGEGWRVPTAAEMVYLYITKPIIDQWSAFGTTGYWTATITSGTDVVRIAMSAGYMTNVGTGDQSTNLVRCIKGGLSVDYPKVTTEYGGTVLVLKDENGGIDDIALYPEKLTESEMSQVTDENHKVSRKFRLQSVGATATELPMGNKEAMEYCHNLTEDGLTNWRLPTGREMLLIWIAGGAIGTVDLYKNDTGVGDESYPYFNILQDAGWQLPEVLSDNKRRKYFYVSNSPGRIAELQEYWPTVMINFSDGQWGLDAMDQYKKRGVVCVCDVD